MGQAPTRCASFGISCFPDRGKLSRSLVPRLELLRLHGPATLLRNNVLSWPLAGKAVKTTALIRHHVVPWKLIPHRCKHRPSTGVAACPKVSARGAGDPDVCFRQALRNQALRAEVGWASRRYCSTASKGISSSRHVFFIAGIRRPKKGEGRGGPPPHPPRPFGIGQPLRIIGEIPGVEGQAELGMDSDAAMVATRALFSIVSFPVPLLDESCSKATWRCEDH